MNENIDLTKILDGCPKGTEFYHSLYGRVYLHSVVAASTKNPIRLSLTSSLWNDEFVTKEGKFNAKYDGDVILFPSKDQRDWSKFERFWDKPKVDKFDPKAFQPFDKVLGWVGNTWVVDLFSFHRGDKLCTMLGYYEKVIPYNEETKHLVGTINDCPEYYKWWEE